MLVAEDSSLPGYEVMSWTILNMEVAVSPETSVTNGVNRHAVIFQRSVMFDV